ncbi:MAG: tetratricopeptide repeat protein [Terriglobia bacterium]
MAVMREELINNREDWPAQDIYLVADKAYQLYQQGHLREAKVLFEGLLAIAPANRYCRLALSAVLASMNDLSGALTQLDEWIARDPRDLEARARRCEVCLRLDLLERTREDLAVLERSQASAHIARLRLIHAARHGRSSSPGGSGFSNPG